MEPVHVSHRCALPAAALLSALLLASSATAAPVPLSPGSPEAMTRVEVRCPTFSWTLEAGATGYELVVYRLGAGSGEEAPEDAAPALSQRLPAGATSWTPPLDRCLEPGESYTWFVRAEVDGAPDRWSEGSLFEVAAPGSMEAGEPAEPAGASGESRPGGRGNGSSPAPLAAAAGGVVSSTGPAAPASLLAKALPPAAFNVSGGTRITGEYAFDQPRRVRKLYSASKFHLQNRQLEDDLWILGDSDFGGFLDGSGALSVDLIASLDDLPPAAEIRALTCRFLDNTATPTSDLGLAATFRLRRRGILATEPQTLASVSIETTGSSSLLREVFDTSIDSPVVLEGQTYWLEGTFDADAASASLLFYGCELEYQVTHVGPLARLPE